ncbi:type IV pilin-like G/H family protein [Microcoleus sp. BR0-C5]|uniref:type IV pilin-like G/H family protein n=1 Tax=Microcoleus sp. BR0-C5 TaxID=2818713 RepID=UPI002FD2621C
MSQENYNSDRNSPIYSGCGCLVLLMFLLPLLRLLTYYAFELPSFLKSANKAKQSEAKQYISSMNKAQQTYLVDKSSFSNSFEALGLGLKTETLHYKYSTRATKQAAFNYGVSKNQKELKSYIGGAFLVPASQVNAKAPKNEIRTAAILCEADSPGIIKPAEPTYENGKIACGKGTIEVTK